MFKQKRTKKQKKKSQTHGEREREKKEPITSGIKNAQENKEISAFFPQRLLNTLNGKNLVIIALNSNICEKKKKREKKMPAASTKKTNTVFKPSGYIFVPFLHLLLLFIVRPAFG